MPRTREEIQRAAAEAETWLDSLDPATTPAENPSDLRRIGLALRGLADEQREIGPIMTYMAGGRLRAWQRSYKAAIDLRRHRRTR